jgi:hypothetical protein
MKATKIISTTDVSSIIASIPAGRIFTATFVKANGETRKMNCRQGVTAFLTTNPKKVKAANPANIITVFDMQKKAYRSINTDTVKMIAAQKRIFAVA